MNRRFLLGALSGVALTLLSGAGLGTVAIIEGLMPANADAEPGALEKWAARTSLKATIAREAPTTPNPIELTDAHLIEGIKLYAENCAVCHGGADGKASNIAQGLYQRPPQFAKKGVDDDPEGVTFWKLTHGIRLTGMPAYAKTLTDDQRWEITLFLKHMESLATGPSRVWQGVR